MRIKAITLDNFRNYKHTQIDFGKANQIAILGNNAQGKSNFLESIYLLAFASSFRTQKPTDIILWNNISAACSGFFESKQDTSFQLSYRINQQGKRQVQLNHQYIRRLSEYIGHVKLVLFSSKDLNMVTGQPNLRRVFLNLLLVQIYPKYYTQLQAYNKLLKQRNLLLKQLFESSSSSRLLQLDVWDEQMSSIAAYLIEKRAQVIESLNGYIQQVHTRISGFQEQVSLKYNPSIPLGESPSPQDLILKEWQRKRNFHIQRKQTLSGPHRDDFDFLLEFKDLKTFGSQGQIRTAVLALKIAELLHLSQIFDEPPILLLDDVFSELDLQRQQALFGYIKEPNIQTIITTTHLDGLVKQLINYDSLILNVDQGHIIRA